MLPLLLTLTATAAPFDSLEGWTGTWDLHRHHGTLVVDASGHFRMELEAERRCFLEGTLVFEEGAVLLGTAAEAESHAAAVAATEAELAALQAALDAEEQEILDLVDRKPKKKPKYEEQGYVFKTWFNAPPEVELPAGHEAVVALATATDAIRPCSVEDRSHPNHLPVLGRAPTLLFPSVDRVILALPQPDGSDGYLRLGRNQGHEPVSEAGGALGGSWVVRMGARDAPAALWGELTAKSDSFEIRWADGCASEGSYVFAESGTGITFHHYGESCHLTTYRRIDDRDPGVYWLRASAGEGPVLILREDGL